MIKVLITGAQGQLGKELNKQLMHKENTVIWNTEVKEDTASQIRAMDITNREEVVRVIEELKPDIIFNCAAHTAVDLCETDRENAYMINAEGPKNLAIAAEKISAVLFQFSTDYVFDGIASEPYTEDDDTNPQSVYGTTKLQGEKFVQENCSRYFIIRTAWLYGDGKNFVKTMLSLAQNRKEITVVCDQYGTPTSAKELAKMSIYLMDTEEYGIYHGTCEGNANWYEFAVQIFKEADKDVRVTPVTADEYPSAACRPVYSVLENQKLNQMNGFTMKEWKEALKEYIETLNIA